MRYIFLLCLVFIPFSGIIGQKYSSSSKKAIALYEEATKMYTYRDYALAEENFLKAIEKDEEFVEAYLVLGEMKLELRQAKEALQYIGKALELSPNFYPPAYISLAKAQLYNALYAEAKVSVEKFLSYGSGSDGIIAEANALLQNCEFAIEAMKSPTDYNPISLGDSINSPYSEYWPSLSADGNTMVYTARLPLESPSAQVPEQEDFFISKKVDGSWTKGESLGRPLNTDDNEGAQTLLSSGNEMYFTACNRADGKGKCDIYYSRQVNGYWLPAVNLGFPVNTKFKEKQPSISPDGRHLYFSSDRTGGKGGMDIWVARRTKDGRWEKPVNLGDTINTPKDELSPFIHFDNSTLYFSSDGHPGMGNKDLYFCRKDSSGKWMKPINLGYPVNTFGDEIGLFINAKGDQAYFSTDIIPNMAGELQDLNIYRFELAKELRPQPVNYMEGHVKDEETKRSIVADFELINVDTKELIHQSVSDAKGKFLVCIPANSSYALNVSKEGYLFYSENFTITGDYSMLEPYKKDVYLHRIKEGESVVLKNVFFDFDSHNLKSSSQVELDKLVSFLMNNPGLSIEIGGHTDSNGDDEYNKDLSKRRANSVYNYLIEKGISKHMLSSQGYGEEVPIDTNETEEGRANNRRTEFKIMKVNEL